MKLVVKMFCLFLALPFVMSAQEKSADEFKNEGNEFVRNKDYKSALASYEQAIQLWGDSLDAATVFNAGDCARRIKANDKAIGFFKKAEELDYKGDFCAYYIADIYKGDGKEAEMEQAYIDAIEKYKTGKPVEIMKKGLATYYLKQGLVPFNEASKILQTAATAKPEEYAGIEESAKAKFAEARPLVEKALEFDAENANGKKMLAEIVSRLGK